MSIDEQLCEYNKMMTEIDKLKEASQYFTSCGHIEVYTKLDEAIGEAEAVAFAKRYWMVREEPELQQVGNRIYFFNNNKVTG
tara:strand:- start:513 stop:758 length:246 start_codon:yes stop_codon:yes gene_type:complete